MLPWPEGPSVDPKRAGTTANCSKAWGTMLQLASLPLQGARSAIRNAPNTRQCCNPPRSAIRHTQSAKSLQ
eukprot:5731482-Alexandrium_andersonii.AAC.1